MTGPHTLSTYLALKFPVSKSIDPRVDVMVPDVDVLIGVPGEQAQERPVAPAFPDPTGTAQVG